MGENLVIVESPAKAKTIEKFLGKEFTVKSSFGHIRDLPKKDIGVDVGNGFAPTYEVPEDKKKVVSELRQLASKVKNVWLASDEDREGEAIAWHLSQVLDLDVKTTKRIVFHEITKSAILKAIENPRVVDINLVNAQQARRILDRLVGFELSPILWRKVKPSLSAGRVQSVAVRLVVEREREIIAFRGGNYFKVTGVFTPQSSKNKVKAELNTRLTNEAEANQFLELCRSSSYKVSAVENKPGKRSPASPFTTSTLQQEASRKLGFSVSQTMTVAQRLYEAGLITYMRTDSVNLSADAIRAISHEITSRFGANYLQNRHYKTKSKGAQEAHEAIRPSYIDRVSIDGTSQEKRLYDLIWKRAVASQMSDCLLERTVVDIIGSNLGDKRFVAKGEVVSFDGFMKLYTESANEDEPGEDNMSILPPMTIGGIMERETIDAVERFDQRPARFSEASLVKHLEELGIGRPSTYAPTISTIINRGYVIKQDREGVKRSYSSLRLAGDDIKAEILSETTGAEKSKLFPTDIGMIVTDYLSSHFPAILDYNFTAKVEEDFDSIAEGKESLQNMIGGFYMPFHKTVESAESEGGSYASSMQRELGVDPESGRKVYARVGRFGPMAQIGETGDETNKPKYAGLQSGQLVETITLEEALQLFRLPRDLGEYEGKSMVVGVGRFGPYIRHNSIFTSLEKSDNAYTITADRAIELIENKRKREREKIITTFTEDEKMQVLNGRFGPYIAYDGANYKIAKGTDPASLSFADCMTIVEAQRAAAPADKKPTARRGRVAAKKTSTTRSKSSATTRAKK